MTGDCALCGHVTRCNGRCGGGAWDDSCEREDGELDTGLLARIDRTRGDVIKEDKGDDGPP